MTTAFTAGGNTYVIDNRGYFIHGENTCDAAVAGFSGSAHYSGQAYGTYWTSTDGTDMTGTFSTNVNFDSGSLTDFNMSVSEAGGGGKFAKITGASGSFASSHFEIGEATGTWELSGGDPLAGARKAVGSLYGPNGEYIGGAWGMKKDSANGANGIFQGQKQ